MLEKDAEMTDGSNQACFESIQMLYWLMEMVDAKGLHFIGGRWRKTWLHFMFLIGAEELKEWINGA